MNNAVALAHEVSPDIEPETLEPEVEDSAQVEAEFKAIMIASGFGDRIVVSTLSRPKPELLRLEHVRKAMSHPRWWVATIRMNPHVRSPPPKR